MYLVLCRKLIVNSFLMPIYYKRLEPFNPLSVSGNSWELIACCQKCRSCKSSPSLQRVGLLFNCSGLNEAAFKNSTLLGGLKEVFEELKAEAEVGVSSVGCVGVVPPAAPTVRAAEGIVAHCRNCSE